MKQLYTTKQVVGGLLLVILFIMVFILNMLNKEYNMLITPILVGLTLCLLAYILVLNEIITTKKKLLLKKDKYVFKTCPDDYTTKVNFLGKVKEIECINSNKSISNFLLQSTEKKCDEGNYGCFNKENNRTKKCENIKTFFQSDTDVNGGILNNWAEYQNQCIL